MNRFATLSLLAMSLMLIAAVPGLASAQTTRPSVEPIRIAGGFAMTGEESTLDLPASRGARLAVKEINASGGVLGRRLELVIHDSKYNMELTAKIAEQWIKSDKVVAGIGYTDNDSILAAGPIVQKAGIPFITAGATSPKLLSQIGDMMFLACFGDNVQAAAGAEFGMKKFGKTACLLGDTGTEYTRLLAGYFKASFVEAGGSLLIEDTFGDKIPDLSKQIAKIKALPKPPDFYYVAAMPYNIGPIIKQFRDAGLNGPIIGGDGYDTPELVAKAGQSTSDVYFSTHALINPDSSRAIKRFIQAYKNEYGFAPEHAFSALGYDTTNLIADAINRAGSTDPVAIQKAIEQTRDFPGITGTISFSTGNHIPEKGVSIISVVQGEFKLADVVLPKKVPAP